jgi:hypothetical protein
MESNTDINLLLKFAQTNIFLTLLAAKAEEKSGQTNSSGVFETTHKQGNAEVTRKRNKFGQFMSESGNAAKEAISSTINGLKQKSSSTIANLDQKYNELSNKAKIVVDEKVSAALDVLSTKKMELVDALKNAPEQAKEVFDGIVKAVKEAPGNLSKRLKAAADSAVKYAKEGDIKGDSRRFAADVFYNVTTFTTVAFGYFAADTIAAIEVGVVGGLLGIASKKPAVKIAKEMVEIARTIQLDRRIVPAVRDMAHPAIQKVSDLIRGEEKEYQYNWFRDGVYQPHKAANAARQTLRQR